MSNSRGYVPQGSFDLVEEDFQSDEVRDYWLRSLDPDGTLSDRSALDHHSAVAAQQFGYAGDGFPGHSPGHSSGGFPFGRYQSDPVAQIPGEAPDTAPLPLALQENHDIPLPNFAQGPLYSNTTISQAASQFAASVSPNGARTEQSFFSVMGQPQQPTTAGAAVHDASRPAFQFGSVATSHDQPAYAAGAFSASAAQSSNAGLRELSDTTRKGEQTLKLTEQLGAEWKGLSAAPLSPQRCKDKKSGSTQFNLTIESTQDVVVQLEVIPLYLESKSRSDVRPARVVKVCSSHDPLPSQFATLSHVKRSVVFTIHFFYLGGASKKPSRSEIYVVNVKVWKSPVMHMTPDVMHQMPYLLEAAASKTKDGKVEDEVQDE